MSVTPDIEEQRHHLEGPREDPQACREAQWIAGMWPVVLPHEDREYPVPGDDDEQAERTYEIDVLVPTLHRGPRRGGRDAAHWKHSLQSGDARGTVRPHQPGHRRGGRVHLHSPRHTLQHGDDELGEGCTLGFGGHTRWLQPLRRRPAHPRSRRVVQRSPRRRRDRSPDL